MDKMYYWCHDGNGLNNNKREVGYKGAVIIINENNSVDEQCDIYLIDLMETRTTLKRHLYEIKY